MRDPRHKEVPVTALQPDLSEFRELSKLRRLRCGVALALEGLGDGEREQLAAALADPMIRHSAIERWLARRGIKVADKTINRHRDGRCACDG